jgi:hypothetical protein
VGWWDPKLQPGLTLFLCLIAWLHLQVQPKSVFEGDTLTLQCQGWKHIRVSQVKFYKDGKFLDFSKTSKTLSIEMATMKSSGQYKCTGEVMYITPGFTQTSATIMVQVQGESPARRPIGTVGCCSRIQFL